MDIVGSDAFLDLPQSSQSLYFHLGMRADDDGFLGNPKSIQRSLGAADDDLKLLLAKRFLLRFPSGVVVVKHWRINNVIRNDRYNPTRYAEEKKMVFLKQNGAYTDDKMLGIPSGNHLATNGMHRIGENRIEKDSIASHQEENATTEEVKKARERTKAALKAKGILDRL